MELLAKGGPHGGYRPSSDLRLHFCRAAVRSVLNVTVPRMHMRLKSAARGLARYFSRRNPNPLILVSTRPLVFISVEVKVHAVRVASHQNEVGCMKFRTAPFNVVELQSALGNFLGSNAVNLFCWPRRFNDTRPVQPNRVPKC